jgi:DNA-binding MarR family transcriptional regulator
VVEDLVRRGLVARKRMNSDRRTYRLNLTPAGKKTLTQLTRCARRHERSLDSIIGIRDRKRFIQILKKIAADIERPHVPGTARRCCRPDRNDFRSW